MVKLLNNFWLKVVALAAGGIIWLHVVTEKSYNYELNLPITEITLKDDLTLAEPPPDSLTVAVSGTGKRLLRRQWRTEGLRINANQYQTGRYKVNVSVVNTFLVNPQGDISLDEVVHPTVVELSIDRRGEIRLPVEADITCSADEGFAVAYPIEIDPPEVVLEGPETMLNSITSVPTIHQDLTGLRTNVALFLPLVTPEGYDMAVYPDSVRLRIEIVPVRTRVYPDLSVVVFNAPSDANLQPKPARVTVEMTGPPDEIALLNANALTVSADYKQLSEHGWAPIKVSCPPNFKVKKTSIDSIQLTPEANADAGH